MQTMPFCSFKCVQIFSFFILITAHYYVTQLNLTSFSFYSSSIFLRMPKNFLATFAFFSGSQTKGFENGQNHPSGDSHASSSDLPVHKTVAFLRNSLFISLLKDSETIICCQFFIFLFQ